MTFRPTQEHTFVTSLRKDEVLEKVKRRVQEVDAAYITPEPLFNGKISEKGFRISSVIKTPQNALPLLIGHVEDTSRGAIVFVKIQLFPAAILYLRFFSILSFLIGLVFLLIPKLFSFASISFAIGALNYLVLFINFHKKAKNSLSEITDLLFEESE